MQSNLCNFWSSPIKFNLLTHDQQRHSHGFVDYPDVNDVELLILLHYQQRSLDYHGVSDGTRTRDPQIKNLLLLPSELRRQISGSNGIQTHDPDFRRILLYSSEL